MSFLLIHTLEFINHSIQLYMSEIEGGNVRGRPPVKWRDRVQEYVSERGEGFLGNLEQARRECQDRER